MNEQVVNLFWRRLSVGALVSTYVFAAGCAGMQASSSQNYAGMTQAEQRLAQQADAYNDTQLEGCLIGAGAGLLGACTIGNCGLKDIAIGVAVGAAVGCTTATYVANLQKKHSTEEGQLNAVIDEMRRSNQDLAAMNRTAQEVVADNKAKVMQLKKEIAAGHKTREQAEQELASTKGVEKTLQGSLANARKKLDTTKQAASQIRSSDPHQQAVAKQEIKQMEQQIATLQSNLQTLAESNSPTGLG